MLEARIRRMVFVSLNSASSEEEALRGIILIFRSVSFDLKQAFIDALIDFSSSNLARYGFLDLLFARHIVCSGSNFADIAFLFEFDDVESWIDAFQENIPEFA